MCAYGEPMSRFGGRCIHEISESCPVFLYIDDVARITAETDSSSIVPYEDKLHDRVCDQGPNRRKEEGIPGPAPSWCPLHAYFNLVVGALEDVQEAAGRVVSS